MGSQGGWVYGFSWRERTGCRNPDLSQHGKHCQDFDTNTKCVANKDLCLQYIQYINILWRRSHIIYQNIRSCQVLTDKTMWVAKKAASKKTQSHLISNKIALTTMRQTQYHSRGDIVRHSLNNHDSFTCFALYIAISINVARVNEEVFTMNFNDMNVSWKQNNMNNSWSSQYILKVHKSYHQALAFLWSIKCTKRKTPTSVLLLL